MSPIQKSELSELLEFFRLDESDLAILGSMATDFEAAADGLIEEFYQHLLRFPSTQNLLRNPEVRNRLLLKQREYLSSLTDPVIDEAYLEDRARIGATHESVGLETRWYLGAYALYFSLLLPVIQRSSAGNQLLVEQATAALQKRLLLDAEIAIRQYTDRREEDLRQLNHELRATGKALTREVDEQSRDLRRTEERAQAAEQLASVATLVSGLAHEVGTPMGVIRGHAEALEGAVEGERAKWRLGIILEQIDRITGIIQSLLNIARPKQSLRLPFHLDEILNTSAAFLTEKLRRRSVTLKTDLAPLPPITGDPEKMQQVFLNLFINSIDAMSEGGTLTIKMGCEGEYAAIRIADTGSGIATDKIEQIFDPFYTTKAAGHGNGLGLVVVKGIIENHGGTIRARNITAGGAEFEVFLPLDPPQDQVIT